jgi:FkbM family methyltransferase
MLQNIAFLALKRIKNSIRVLFSKDIVFDLSIDDALGIVGRSNIRYFVQIGSNDGKKNDPLYAHIIHGSWKGILVEPDPMIFRKLKETYKMQSGLIFENVGIAPERGELVFYKLKNVTSEEPIWYDQIGSFDHPTFMKNISHGRDLEIRVETMALPVITFDDLVSRHPVGKVDLLHMDTEGFDYRILRSIDFKKYPIRLIIFEAEWMTQFELREIIEWLRRFQYRLYRCGGDYIAISR